MPPAPRPSSLAQRILFNELEFASGSLTSNTVAYWAFFPLHLLVVIFFPSFYSQIFIYFFFLLKISYIVFYLFDSQLSSVFRSLIFKNGSYKKNKSFSLNLSPLFSPLLFYSWKLLRAPVETSAAPMRLKKSLASGYRGSKENRLQAENISPGPPGARVHDIFSTDWPWGEVGSPRNSLPKPRMGGGWLFSSSSPAGCIINTFPETKWEKLIPYVMKQLPLEWRSSKVVKRHDLMSSVHTYHSTQHLHRSIHS